MSLWKSKCSQKMLTSASINLFNLYRSDGAKSNSNQFTAQWFRSVNPPDNNYWSDLLLEKSRMQMIIIFLKLFAPWLHITTVIYTISTFLLLLSLPPLQSTMHRSGPEAPGCNGDSTMCFPHRLNQVIASLSLWDVQLFFEWGGSCDCK